METIHYALTLRRDYILKCCYALTLRGDYILKCCYALSLCGDYILKCCYALSLCGDYILKCCYALSLCGDYILKLSSAMISFLCNSTNPPEMGINPPNDKRNSMLSATAYFHERPSGSWKLNKSREEFGQVWQKADHKLHIPILLLSCEVQVELHGLGNRVVSNIMIQQTLMTHILKVCLAHLRESKEVWFIPPCFPSGVHPFVCFSTQFLFLQYPSHTHTCTHTCARSHTHTQRNTESGE